MVLFEEKEINSYDDCLSTVINKQLLNVLHDSIEDKLKVFFEKEEPERVYKNFSNILYEKIQDKIKRSGHLENYQYYLISLSSGLFTPIHIKDIISSRNQTTRQVNSYDIILTQKTYLALLNFYYQFTQDKNEMYSLIEETFKILEKQLDFNS